MHPNEIHYYTINKVLMKILGIWPYDRSRFILLRQMLFIFLTTTYISIQLSNFITQYNKVFFLKVMPLACPFIILTLMYCIFIFKLKVIRDIYYQIREDWEILQDKLENEIMKKYAHHNRFFTIIGSSIMGSMWTIGIIVQLLPIILDIILPLDKPRPRKLLIPVEYFVFQDKYFYTKVLHEFIIIAIYGLITLTTGTQMYIFFCHCFRMFKVASYRMEHAIEDNVLQMPHLIMMKHAVHKRIIRAIIAHRRAVEFVDILISSFNMSNCILITVGVLSLSINLYNFIEAATISKNMEDTIIYFTTTLCHLYYMYMGNYIGQMICDCNNEFFRAIYDTSWYLAPVSTQKLILFLMQKAGKDVYFSIGYIFVTRMETFTMLLNAAMSYVAVMYSIK